MSEEKPVIKRTKPGLQMQDLEEMQRESAQAGQPKEEVLEPTFSIELPSMGRCGYTSKFKFRPFKVKELKVLSMSSSNDDLYIEKLTECLQACCATDFDIKNLTVQDFVAVMIAMRINSISPTYEVIITCPSCKKTFDTSVDLTKLPVKDLPETYKEPCKIDGYNMIMPRVGQNLETLKADDEYDIIHHATGLDIEVFDNLPAPTYLKFTKWFEDNDYGYDDRKKIKCEFKECGKEVNFTIPFRTGFVV